MNDEEFAARVGEIKELLERVVTMVARANYQSVRPDDPVMVIPTIAKVLADDAAESHMKMLRQHANEHEAAALRWRMDAKEAGERILNVALDVGRKQVAASTAEAGKNIRESIRSEMEGAISQLRAENEAGRKTHAPMVLAGGILAFLGGVAALLAVVLIVN